MSALVTLPAAGALPASLQDALPRVGRDIAAAAARALSPVAYRGATDPDDPGMRLPPIPLPRDRWLVAQDAALAISQVLASPIDLEDLAQWLTPFRYATGGPRLSQDDFRAKVKALLILLDEPPAVLFTDEARLRLRGEFFPTLAEVREAIRPEQESMESMRTALRSIPQGEPEYAKEAPPRPPEDRSDIESVRAFRERQTLLDRPMGGRS